MTSLANRWIQMGVELEGGWNKDTQDVASKVVGARAKTDGSVRTPGIPGEIITRPHDNLKLLLNDVSILYPDFVNETCGFHIHASFNPMDTGMLASNDFWQYYSKFWEAWANDRKSEMTPDDWRCFQTRLSGTKFGNQERSFCEKKFIPEDQLFFNKHRYTQLNFVAYSKYKTIENRLLPMFQSKELAMKAIVACSEMYNSFLEGYTFPEISLENELKEDGDTLVEEVRLKEPSMTEIIEDFKVKTKEAVVGEDIHYSIPGAQDLMMPFTTIVRGNSL